MVRRTVAGVRSWHRGSSAGVVPGVFARDAVGPGRLPCRSWQNDTRRHDDGRSLCAGPQPGERRTRRCGWCRRVLPEQGSVGRPRLYCGQACRQRAYEQRSATAKAGLPGRRRPGVARRARRPAGPAVPAAVRAGGRPDAADRAADQGRAGTISWPTCCAPPAGSTGSGSPNAPADACSARVRLVVAVVLVARLLVAVVRHSDLLARCRRCSRCRRSSRRSGPARPPRRRSS